MAFDPVVTRTPSAIGKIDISLLSFPDVDTPDGIKEDGYYRFEVLDQDGQVLGHSTGDLQPHLSPEQTAQIVAFLDWCRAQAEAALPAV